jgi:GNAT superfamily N-acetyltransferase
MWQIFRKYHYLNHEINKSSRQFVAFIGDEPVAFDSVLHLVHPTVKNAKRKHRLVVRPDYQGIGIGSKLSDFVSQKMIEEGYRVFSTTSSPALIQYRKKSNRWKLKRSGRKIGGKANISMNASSKRYTTSWEYV